MQSTRRAFVWNGIWASAALTLGCGGGTSGASMARGGAGPGGRGGTGPEEPGYGGAHALGGDGGLGGAPGGAGGAHADGGVLICRSTPPDIEGPFFTPGSPERSMLVEDGMDGTVLTLTGRVLDGACEPVGGAIVDLWQADVTGAYDNVGARLRGHQITDALGVYSFTTIVPGRYLNGAQYRPAHIHAKVAAPGRALLTTQLYFEGDPFNDVDPWFNEDTMLTPSPGEGGRIAEFDFVVA